MVVDEATNGGLWCSPVAKTSSPAWSACCAIVRIARVRSVSFGDEEHLPGIDLILPDIAFLEKERKNLVGLVLTHAHEDHFGLDRLIGLCEALAPSLHAMRVGRVIARPFLGEAPGTFRRTGNRRDFAIAPPGRTILDIAQGAGRVTHAIGKIGDIFSHRGITRLHKGKSDADLADHLIRLGRDAEPGSLTFANFVEFDTNFGHRRDIPGYAAQLEWFDGVAGRFLAALRSGDLAIFTADHGNDPSWAGTDHTRERVAVLGHGLGAQNIGLVGFSDIGASTLAHLGLPPPDHGRSFL